MKELNINTMALAIGLVFSAGAMAQGMSKSDFEGEQDKIAAEYKSGKVTCASLSGNANDVCVAQIKGKEKVSTAELEAFYRPSRKASYAARVAKAEADYGVAKEQCDGLAGNAKDVCVKEATAAETAGKADAKAQLKTAEANDTANKKSAKAHSEADSKAIDARADAATDKLDAQYEVAKQKCDVYAGGAKDRCLDQAKLTYGKS